jgi:hypothetical protein
MHEQTRKNENRAKRERHLRTSPQSTTSRWSLTRVFSGTLIASIQIRRAPWRMPLGPKRAPGRKEVAVSNGAPAQRRLQLDTRTRTKIAYEKRDVSRTDDGDVVRDIRVVAPAPQRLRAPERKQAPRIVRCRCLQDIVVLECGGGGVRPVAMRIAAAVARANGDLRTGRGDLPDGEQRESQDERAEHGDGQEENGKRFPPCF